MEFSQEKIRFFAKYIEKELGIVYSDSNYFQLEHRLSDITSQLGLKSLEDLWMRATSGIDTQLKELLLDIATNNETSFFRDPSLFVGLVKSIVPELLSANPQLKELRIWSAACSNGQEPYSIAMALDEARSENPNFPNYKILATDFSERVLSRTKARTYSQLELQRGLSASRLQRYFDPGSAPNTWVLNSRIPPSNFQFQQLNLLDPWNFDHNFHIVFCRNVLIYQNVDNKIRVIDKILKVFEKDAYLALGAAESLLGISDLFEQVHFENSVFYRKKRSN